MKTSKLRKNLDLLHYELEKGIIELESEIVSLKYEYDEALETRNRLMTKIMELNQKVKDYENMTFRQRLLFLFFRRGFKIWITTN